MRSEVGGHVYRACLLTPANANRLFIVFYFWDIDFGNGKAAVIFEVAGLYGELAASHPEG